MSNIHKAKNNSDDFTSMILREFGNSTGNVPVLTDHQKRLAQHLYVRIDMILAELEQKRLQSQDGENIMPYVWPNVNLPKLAVDAIHRMELGLDAMSPGHLYCIPYKNNKLQKWDMDLRVGYKGEDYYKREMAQDQPIDVVYELVHETDMFDAHKGNGISGDTYTFIINNPFNRGPVVGGFGYIKYENPDKNKIVLISEQDFEKSKKCAKSQKFWSDYPEEMRFKTVVHRVLKMVNPDPKKVTQAYAIVEQQETTAMFGEIVDEDRRRIEPPRESPPPPQQSGVRYITEPQRKRLYVITKSAGREPQDVKDYLSKLGIDSAEHIPYDQYNKICNWVQSDAN